jgi:hypothetical protein
MVSMVCGGTASRVHCLFWVHDVKRHLRTSSAMIDTTSSQLHISASTICCGLPVVCERMASAVVLPGSQRRLRHVEALCFRNLSMPDQERVTRARGMTLTTRMRRGTVTHRAQTEAKAETALLPSTRFHLYSPHGEVFYTSEVCASSLHPTFAPLPQDVRSFTSPKLRIVLENVDTGKAIMDVEVDVRRLTFESRTLANARSGNTTGLVMFKCEDGIFKIGGRSRHGPATTENGAAAAEGAQGGGGGNSDDEDTWDLVDADCVLREDERKRQGRETVVDGRACDDLRHGNPRRLCDYPRRRY